MKAILKITVTQEINQDDKECYEDFLADGDITSIYECFNPECEGKYEKVKV